MSRKLKVLLVEDNPADVDLTRETFEIHELSHELFTVSDGVEALAFLRQEAPYQQAPRPDLILLDLNLPRRDGIAVLSALKADEALRRIPVVVLTSSEAEQDVLKSYELQASAYVTKPVSLEGFDHIVEGLNRFWFSVVRFPKEDQTHGPIR